MPQALNAKDAKMQNVQCQMLKLPEAQNCQMLKLTNAQNTQNTKCPKAQNAQRPKCLDKCPTHCLKKPKILSLDKPRYALRSLDNLKT